MNRRLLIQAMTPVVLFSIALFGVCAVTVWYIGQLETNLSRILSENVASLEAAQELEIRVRQLRTHCLIYLIDPTPAHLEPLEMDNQRFEEALQTAKKSSNSSEEVALVQSIETGYRQYRDELARLREDVTKNGPRKDFGKLHAAHPIRHVTDPCHELFRMNQEAMDQTFEETKRVSRQAHFVVFLLGVIGPLSGLLVGYRMARVWSRSVYKLSVRVQDMAHHLDEKVASMRVVVDGDIENVDKQLQHVLTRVEEVTKRLQHQQSEMLRAEQLAAVGQLAASVAHEVRNPLMSVKMLVDAAIRPQKSQPLTPEDLQIIHGELVRLEQTVQGFLNFARLPTPKLEVCDLKKIIAQAVELVRVRARQQRVDINVSLPDENASVLSRVDGGQFHTVLINLLMNALDAMPRGGRLQVALASAPNSEIRLTVSDTGAGIAPEIINRLFTPFTSSKPTGTGLGLSISQRIIEEHGGRISAVNLPKEGACFTITLPRQENGSASDDHTALASSISASSC